MNTEIREQAVGGNTMSSAALLKIKRALVSEGVWGKLRVHGGSHVITFTDDSGQQRRSTVVFAAPRKSSPRAIRTDEDRERSLQEMEHKLGLRR